MAKAETSAQRSPRGTKPVSQAFFTALDSVPEASRAAVAKAAHAMIRDELKLRRDKMKVAAAKEKEKARKTVAAPKPVSAKAPAAKAKAATTSAVAQPAPKPNGADNAAAPVKRRTRKPADLPTPGGGAGGGGGLWGAPPPPLARSLL